MRTGILDRPAPAAGRVLPQLDALRGLAILAVFVQHLGDSFRPLWERDALALGPAAPWVLTIVHHAWWGVDLFFVVSGFSLALGYLRAFDSGRPPTSARSFLLRRAVRIYPAFVVAIGVVLAHRPWLLEAPGVGSALAAHAALLQGYIAPGGIVFIGAAWSLTTEAHFYVLMPLLAGPLLGRRAYRLGAALCVLVWIVRAVLHAAVLEPGVHTGLFELSQRRWIVSRLDLFLLGMMAAALLEDIRRAGLEDRAARLAPYALFFSAVALVLSFRLEGELYLSPGGSWPCVLMSLSTAALVLAACCLRAVAPGEGAARGSGGLQVRASVARWIAPLPLRALGVVSYGVFLYHQLALGILGARLAPPGVPLSWGRMALVAVTALAASVIAGLASWLLVERPFLWGSGPRRDSARALSGAPPRDS